MHKEVAVHQAAASAGIPVPDLLGACDDASLIGEQFFAMAHVDGDFPHLAELDDWPVWQSEAGRRRVAEQIVEVMGQLHRLDWAAAGLPDLVTGQPGASGAELMAGLVNRWMGNVERDVYPTFAPVPILRDAARFLVDHAPEMPDFPPVLSHGDYRIGNLAFQGDDLVAVLDWERAAVGPPLLDLGFFCHPLSRRRRPELMGMLVTWDELAALYTAATGTEPDPKWVHYCIIYWIFVESAVVPRGLALTVEGKMRSWPVFTQIPPQHREPGPAHDRLGKGRHELDGAGPLGQQSAGSAGANCRPTADPAWRSSRPRGAPGPLGRPRRPDPGTPPDWPRSRRGSWCAAGWNPGSEGPPPRSTARRSDG